MDSERKRLVELIQETNKDGARLKLCCLEVGISLRTYRRWYHAGKVQTDQRAHCSRAVPSNKLTEQERQNIIDLCSTAAYADLPPNQIVPDLLDKGVYYASESSLYRVLKEVGQLNHRGQSQAPKKYALPRSYQATQANELWSWDITYLASTVKGQFYYLYLFVDIFSRKIVGYEVYEKECGQLASQLLQRSMFKEQCFNQSPSLVLHSDNGAPMKSLTLKAKMEELGVNSSYSRPRVSNDNPFSEALFRTLKYTSNWPSSGFRSLDDARNWVQQFVDWYNNQHKHSQLNYVSPAERHEGLDSKILQQRKQVLEKARRANPLRWSGAVRNCEAVGPVTLNPEREENCLLKMTG